MKLFAGAVALNWTTHEVIAWNDRPAHDAPDDDAWSRKRVSIVVPARNESKAIGRLLKQLRRALEPEAAEIIVSVGDSVDDTAAIAAAHGAIVVTGAKGRGNQMNAGRANRDWGLRIVFARGYDAAGGRRGRHSSTTARSEDRRGRVRVAHRDEVTHVLGDVVSQRRQDDVLRGD